MLTYTHMHHLCHSHFQVKLRSR